MAIARRMSGGTRRLGTALAVLTLVVGVAQGKAKKPKGQSFTFLQADFTQSLYGVTSSFLRNAYLGGVAVLPGGDVMVAECVKSGTRLHRFKAPATYTSKGTELHQETILPSGGGCGMVYHPDGTLYLNMNDGTNGVANVNPATGAVIRKFGLPGNALGIAVDPITGHLVYANKDCDGIHQPCKLYDVDPVTKALTSLVSFKPNEVWYVDGLSFDPTGTFILMDNRYPTPPAHLTVINRAGTIVQDIVVPSEPAGIGFHDASPKFVVTNNTDGTMTRLDFPNNDYTQVPTIVLLASGG